MAFESLLALVAPPAVHAKPDVGRVNPEGQNKRESRDRPKRNLQDDDTSAHPIPNALGEITGKLIDTTA